MKGSAFVPRPSSRGPTLARELAELRTGTGANAWPKHQGAEFIGAATDASAFAGCSNRTRLAASIGIARVSGTFEGLNLGFILGAVAGVVAYAVTRKKGGDR